MNVMASKLRIGRNIFTNVWPVFHHLPAFLTEDVEFVTQAPTGLNRALAEGAIQIGAISSFSYAEHARLYELLPDLSVSSFGKVNSILLFHRRPLDELKHARIALPTTSATSVNLLKILLSVFYDCDPDYFYAAPSLDDMMKEADAALLIGDDAIRASWRGTPGLIVTDLGEAWQRWTGAWMTYAVWAVRRDAAVSDPAVVESVFRAFQMSKRMGTRQPRHVIEQAVREVGGTPAYWSMYFSRLSHDFGEPQQAGLSLYYKYAAELGLLENAVDIRLWHGDTVA